MFKGLISIILFVVCLFILFLMLAGSYILKMFRQVRKTVQDTAEQQARQKQSFLHGENGLLGKDSHFPLNPQWRRQGNNREREMALLTKAVEIGLFLLLASVNRL